MVYDSLVTYITIYQKPVPELQALCSTQNYLRYLLWRTKHYHMARIAPHNLTPGHLSHVCLYWLRQTLVAFANQIHTGHIPPPAIGRRGIPSLGWLTLELFHPSLRFFMTKVTEERRLRSDTVHLSFCLLTPRSALLCSFEADTKLQLTTKSIKGIFPCT